MNLEEYHDKIMIPSIVKSIKDGKLDNAIFKDDCQDIINDNDIIKAAVEDRIKVLKGVK